jgi:RND family efflux transporter MFP subunit
MRRLMLVGALVMVAAAPVSAATLATHTVAAQADGGYVPATGMVEAVRQGTLASQVSGRVIAVLVRNGDAVKAGQPLIRIDASEAADAAAASAATAGGAEARLATARAEYERAQRLRSADYISVAAMQRAEAALRSAEADAQASRSQAQAARTRAGWHTVTAPYAGHVTELWVSAGDLAAPGKPLVAIYDPVALRVVAQLPESLAARVMQGRAARLAVDGAAPMAVDSWRMVPAVNAVTHSVEVRAELPSGSRLLPGQFVNLQLPVRDAMPELRIPLAAVVRRSEVVGVYVVDAQGVAHLRQVRLGPVVGDSVVVLAGVRSGERVALDPVAAGRRQE